MVPLSPTCSSETSPSARVTTRTPAKTACLWKAAMCSWSREKRSRLSASTTSIAPPRMAASSAW